MKMLNNTARFAGRIVLAIIYFGIFTPVGFLLRLFGYDPLRFRTDGAAETYFHTNPERETGHMDKPY